MGPPKVSVCITTYNHERYIAQAIESVLMQEVDFEYEVIVGEDDSEDGTREIVMAYAEQHPEPLRVFLNDRRNVIYIHGRPTGRWNFVNNLKNAKGQYIALLEGDDYWSNPLKLQKQVDFLDQHQDIAFCYHFCEYLYDDGTRAPQLPGVALRKPRATLPDLLYPVTIPTCSVVFRRSALGPLPEWFFKLPWADWPLCILLAQSGDVAYLEESMAVYRVHSAGISRNWSTGTYLRGVIDMFQYVNEHLGYRYDDIIRGRLSKYYLQMSVAQANAGDIGSARLHLKKALGARPFAGEMGMGDLAVTIGRLYTPTLYRLGRRLFLRREEAVQP